MSKRRAENVPAPTSGRFSLELSNDAAPHAAVSHRFRDTFAVELLLAGVPIERVSILLGHQSVRVTEKHYNPWVRSRQEQLEADVAVAWTHDAILQSKMTGTNQVQIRKERVN